MGYGSRALQGLNSFYSGEYFNLDETSHLERSHPDATATDKAFPIIFPQELYIPVNELDNHTVRSINAMPPLLQRLTE